MKTLYRAVGHVSFSKDLFDIDFCCYCCYDKLNLWTLLDYATLLWHVSCLLRINYLFPFRLELILGFLLVFVCARVRGCVCVCVCVREGENTSYIFWFQFYKSKCHFVKYLKILTNPKRLIVFTTSQSS